MTSIVRAEDGALEDGEEPEDGGEGPGGEEGEHPAPHHARLGRTVLQCVVECSRPGG